MSGIVGIMNLDGAPVDRDLLKRMTEFLAYRDALEDSREVFGLMNVRAGFPL